jgi:NADH dehydrogenase [ubiquinone] 1 alpha subcomplex assembly factor 5
MERHPMPYIDTNDKQEEQLLGEKLDVMSDAMNVFDRGAIRLHRDRAAGRLDTHDFLLREVGERLADRLDDIRRTFPLMLDLGCHSGQLGRLIGRRGGVETLIHCDVSWAMAAIAPAPAVVADEEFLPFGNGKFDAVLSLLSLHWVNDLPGALRQIRMALKADGLFLAAMLGGDTLKELRHAMMEAESATEGGVSPRVSPFADVRDAGGLLQRAGFALPVVDTETIEVRYPDPLKLMADLRGMGESNAVRHRRKKASRRATLLNAAARYAETFGDASGIPATFQILYLTAWAPDASQQQPLRPGSAKIRLADALGSTEIASGVKADPDTTA